MADLERRVSTLEEHMAHVVATLDTLATNQNRLDEALVTLTEAQIRTQEQLDRNQEQLNRNQEQINRTQEQFRETDARIANLTSAIGQLIVEMRSRAN
jgi:chromosome segregation ATPase